MSQLRDFRRAGKSDKIVITRRHRCRKLGKLAQLPANVPTVSHHNNEDLNSHEFSPARIALS